METPPLKSVSLLRSRSKDRCLEFALVLLAMGIRCDLVYLDDEFDLKVYAEDADRAREQVRLYVQENKSRPNYSVPHFGVQEGLTCAWLYAIVILSVYVLQRDHLFAIEWEQLGMSQAGRVQAGEWWRVVTALSLHVDTAHLVSNLAFGFIFVFLAGEMLGWGLAWAGILLAGSFGNLLNAFVHAPNHASIGASTAIFAAVGILSACSWSRRRTRTNRWVPLGGGVALLAFIGLSGERTDIFAHIAGLGSGFLFGFGLGTLETYVSLSNWYRQAIGIAAILFFALAWVLALTA